MTKLNPSIFREYDIRGIALTELSVEFAKQLGQAYAYLWRKQFKSNASAQISVGQDCRLSSPVLAAALAEGLRLGGMNVVWLGVCPTPLTYFSIFDQSLDGGIMVTGSHNPAEYNGFKICMGKDTLHGDQIQEIRKVLESGEVEKFLATQSRGSQSEFAIIPKYIEALLKNALPLNRKRKVVLDAGNGTAGSVAPELFRRLGADVVPLFCELDGRFPNHHPDPTVPKNLTALIQKVKEVGAAFGVGFDGDSDRIGLVNEKGEVIFGDELMVLLSREVLKQKPGATIISEVKSSHRLYNDIAKNGGKPIMWKTGHSLIKSKLKETGAALAGEMSGHIFFADRYYGYDDAIYAALRVYEIACATDAPFSSLLADLPKLVATPEIRVDCPDAKKFDVVARTKALVREIPNVKINDIDGVRVDFGDAWALVRASNTQPVLVLRFEAPNQERMNSVRASVESALGRAAQELGVSVHVPHET